MAKKHIKTLSSATLKESAAKGGCGDMSNFLSICMQNFLHSCKPRV